MSSLAGMGIPTSLDEAGAAWGALLEWEAGFDGWPLIHWIQANWALPLVCCAAYLLLVFGGPGLLKGCKPMKPKVLLAMWNLSLSVFSWIGVSRCLPRLISTVSEQGVKYTLCTHPQEWYMKGGVALWMGLFCLSKLPELIDTLFLVLRQRPVIFLHWYHHVSVLLYCWHAYHHVIPAGIWFACMNYTVHGIMYFYFFLMAIGQYKIAKSIAGMVTTLQIVQMLIGSAIMGAGGYYFLTEGEAACYNNHENVFLGLGMYISYLLLFAAFAFKRYVMPAKKETPAKKTQ